MTDATLVDRIASIPVNDSGWIGTIVVIHRANGFEVECLGRALLSAENAAAQIEAYLAKRNAPRPTPVSDPRFFSGSYEAARAHFGGSVVKMPGTGILHGSVSQWAKR